MKFRRETATHEADLPHEFVKQEQSVLSVCEVCEQTPNEPRHVAWEREKTAHREIAHSLTGREMGS